MLSSHRHLVRPCSWPTHVSSEDNEIKLTSIFPGSISVSMLCLILSIGTEEHLRFLPLELLLTGSYFLPQVVFGAPKHLQPEQPMSQVTSGNIFSFEARSKTEPLKASRQV